MLRAFNKPYWSRVSEIETLSGHQTAGIFASWIRGICFLIWAFSALHVHAQSWTPTGVDGVKYDKERITRLNKPDTFSMWFWSEFRERRGDARVVGAVLNSEIDCYDKEMRLIAAWHVLEDRSLRQTDSFSKRDSFGAFDQFLSSTVCKQANEFYKKPSAAPQQPRWYEFWKR